MKEKIAAAVAAKKTSENSLEKQQKTTDTIGKTLRDVIKTSGAAATAAKKASDKSLNKMRSEATTLIKTTLKKELIKVSNAKAVTVQ